jgi:hypothetical protein
MLVLIGGNENHGPFGKNSMVPNGPWRYGLSLARGAQARHARAAGGSGAQPSPAAFQLGLRRRSIRNGGRRPMRRIPPSISRVYLSGFK